VTASITGYAVYQGLSTSLDTLCSQAYGSGRPHLVGLQLQRMLYFLWVITIPIAIIWACGEQILARIVPDPETARLAGLYLRVLIAGAPGYAAFEGGKRYLQAQGLFSANMYILLFCAPLNALMHYIFVWRLDWGFVGAPIAVAITENLMPIMLFCYVRFIDGYQCWGGFDRRALKNWGPMIRLAIPGLVMVLAEFLAFEILTLSSSWLGPTTLAAQSVLGSVTGITFQIPFTMSVAASTRIANLIGATLHEHAKVAAKVAAFFSVVVGIFNLLFLSLLRNWIPRLFTPDEDVIDLVASLLPLCAAFQLFDSMQANSNGILRGIGKQEIGSYIALFSYYIIGMPISFGLAFGAGWGLWGLWTVSLPYIYMGGRDGLLTISRDPQLHWASLPRLKRFIFPRRVGRVRLRLRRRGMLWMSRGRRASVRMQWRVAGILCRSIQRVVFWQLLRRHDTSQCHCVRMPIPPGVCTNDAHYRLPHFDTENFERRPRI
jgi:MATE family multidrug resistance protein